LCNLSETNASDHGQKKLGQTAHPFP
jgi:hypothetical protein